MVCDEEIDFTCLSNKQFQMIKKGYNKIKKLKTIEKVKTENKLLQYHDNNNIIHTYNIDYSNTHHWLMKE